MVGALERDGGHGPRLVDVTLRRGTFEFQCETCESSPGLTVDVGLNGAGKSTLLNLMNGSLRPDSGQVDLARCVLLPQSAVLEGQWTVRDFLWYIALLRGVPRQQRKGRVASVVVLVGLENYFETQLGKLSGGWAQRVLIAQCLLGDDSGLLLDEPTSSLDVGAARDVWQLVKSLSSSSPCVATTHDASAALEFGDRIVAIDNGIVLPPRDGNELRASFAESRMSPEAFLLELLTA